MTAAASPAWSYKSSETMIASISVFVALFIIIYFIVLKPLFRAQPDVNSSPTPGIPQTPQQQRTGSTRIRAEHPSRGRGGSAGANLAVITSSTRRPPHLANKQLMPSILVDGLIPFRHTKAPTFESSKQQEAIYTNRRDRARLFTNLFAHSGTVTMPPGRGGTIVVSIRDEDVGDEKVSRILFLLGTYYNLFVLIVVSPGSNSDNFVASFPRRLRGENSERLPVEVLPDHRIVATGSVAGRVAFVRQLARVEFVLDFSTEVKMQLGRFGFAVIIYERDQPRDGSPLARLLP